MDRVTLVNIELAIQRFYGHAACTPRLASTLLRRGWRQVAGTVTRLLPILPTGIR